MENMKTCGRCEHYRYIYGIEFGECEAPLPMCAAKYLTEFPFPTSVMASLPADDCETFKEKVANTFDADRIIDVLEKMKSMNRCPLCLDSQLTKIGITKTREKAIYQVICGDCGFVGPAKNNKDKAIEEWNKL